MEVRTESKTGPAAAPLPEIVNRIRDEMNQQQKVWLQQLCADPSRFGEVEVQVHRVFQDLADQVTAGLLAQVGQHPQLAEDAKKK